MICHSLIHDFRQPYPAQNAVPLRASHPGIKQGPFHMILNLIQLKAHFAAQVRLHVPAHKPGGGDRGLDFVDPLFYILPVLLLSGPGVGYRFGHSPSRPAGQVEEPPFIQALWGRDTLGKQIFLIQSLQNGL